MSDLGSFVQIQIGLFFQGPDPDRQKNPGRIRILKKPAKKCKYKKNNLSLSTLSIFGQYPPKSNQRKSFKTRLDCYNIKSKKTNGAGSGFLKSGSAKKPGSIRIRNTDIFYKKHIIFEKKKCTQHVDN